MRVDWHEHCPTQTRNSGRAAPATKYFSGNGIAVAAMCAALHKHRPVAANEGGGSGPAIDPDFGPSVGPCMGPQHLTAPKSKSPISV